MIKNKKGAVTELSVIIFGIIFISLLNLSLGFILDSSLVSSYDPEVTVIEFVDSLDLNFFYTGMLIGLLTIVNLFFSLFGVNFVSAISVVPTLFITLIGLFNSIVIFALIMYLINRLWIG